MTTTKVFKTDKDSILIVTAKTNGCAGRQYVSVTANEIEPILKEDAIKQERENLEDGELWRQAVEAENTELGLSDWVEYVIEADGELAGFDNSLYTNEINIEGEEYIFASASCGCLHDEIKKLTKEFNTLISLHLKDGVAAITKAENIITKMQKTEDTDIDFLVEKYTRQIIGTEA